MTDSYVVPVTASARFLTAFVLALLSLVLLPLVIGYGVWATQRGGVVDLISGIALVVLGAILVPQALRTIRPGIRFLRASAVRLRLDDDGITVNSALPPTPGPAHLTWSDCAAVVVSPVQGRTGDLVYVQFLAVREELIESQASPASTKVKAQLCGVSEAAAAMVWLAPSSARTEVDALVCEVRRRRPGLRVVDGLQPEAPEEPGERGEVENR